MNGSPARVFELVEHEELSVPAGDLCEGDSHKLGNHRSFIASAVHEHEHHLNIFCR